MSDPHSGAALVPYERACQALAEAKRVDEVLDLADKASAMKEYARRANNRQLEVDAAEIRIRAERRLGEMLSAAKAVGQVAEGRPPKDRRKNGSGEEPFSQVTLKEAGIDKKLSSRAQKLAAMPEKAFKRELSGWRKEAEAEGARVSVRLVKGEAQATKADKRREREKKLGEIMLALPTKKYGVIVADDEWDHEVWSEGGMDRHAANHYEVADDAHTAAELHERTKARFECAADDCLLAMWSTVQHLAIAVDLLRLRGFRYVSHYVWGKDKIGLGYWNRNKHEILLLGVKGSIPCPAQGTQDESLIMAPRGKHSAKPERFLEMLERYFPTLPKLELNRRGPARPGWDAWGNQAHGGESDGSGQHIGRSDEEQHDASPVSGSQRRRKGQDAGGEGQGPGTSRPDRKPRNEPRSVSGQDESRGSGHVGGEAHHGLTLTVHPQGKKSKATQTALEAMARVASVKLAINGELNDDQWRVFERLVVAGEGQPVPDSELTRLYYDGRPMPAYGRNNFPKVRRQIERGVIDKGYRLEGRSVAGRAETMLRREAAE